MLEALGYTVDHRVLNAADYGDPTSRRRLFVAASRTKRPTYPDPTYAEDPDESQGADELEERIASVSQQAKEAEQ